LTFIQPFCRVLELTQKQTMKLKITIQLLLLLLLASPCFAFQGKCVGIADGDTITVLTEDKTQHKIRLYGIDCPEKGQDFGHKAKQFTSDKVFGKTVEVEAIDKDRYGRTVGMVSIRGQSLNEELLRTGYAWVYTRYCKKPFCAQWGLLQQQARANKKGLWAHPNSVAPWDFRRGTSRGQQAVTGPLHGNTNSMVFHAPSCKYFNCSNCTMVFSSKDEALATGYRPCGLCKP